MNKKKENKNWGGINNEKEIKENCKLYINDKKIDFCSNINF